MNKKQQKFLEQIALRQFFQDRGFEAKAHGNSQVFVSLTNIPVNKLSIERTIAAINPSGWDRGFIGNVKISDTLNIGNQIGVLVEMK